MENFKTCQDCGATLPAGITCQAYFDQMLVWEWEDQQRLVVHHLMVLGFHLQHPGLYSPEGLTGGIKLMLDFVESGLTTEQARRQLSSKVNSRNRNWKIKGTLSSPCRYALPVSWTMTASDVILAGAEKYCDSVWLWARSICEALKVSGNLKAEPARIKP